MSVVWTKLRQCTDFWRKNSQKGWLNNLTRLVYAVLRCTLQCSLVLQCTCDDLLLKLKLVFWTNLQSLTCRNNSTMRMNLVLPLIRWSIVFAFGSRGPANSTCIIKRWMSSPSTFYAWKFCKVHECELTKINHRRVTCPRCYARGVGEAAAVHRFMKK